MGNKKSMIHISKKQFKATRHPITKPPQLGNKTPSRAADFIVAVLPPLKGSEPASKFTRTHKRRMLRKKVMELKTQT